MIYRCWIDANFYARLIIYTVVLRNFFVMIHVPRISESAAAHFQHATSSFGHVKISKIFLDERSAVLK